MTPRPDAGIPVCILLSTFNGEAFLVEQIESIRRQTFRDWVLLIRDDGSSDATRQLLTGFVEKDPRIRIVESAPTGSTLGAAASFGKLLLEGLETRAKITFLADQDDCWVPDKIEVFLGRFSDEERPRLVFSDYRVTDDRLTPAPEERTLGCLGHDRLSLSSLLSMNCIPGCTLAFNRALAKLAAPIPAQSPMHDWWLALVAAALDSIVYIERPLLLYRQHAGNAVGAVTVSQLLRNPFAWPSLWRKGQEELQKTFAQAGILEQRLERTGLVSGGNLQQLKAYAELPKRRRLQRVRLAKRWKWREKTRVAQALLYARLIALD